MINNVNSRRHVDSEKIRAPCGIWTHDPPWSSRMLYHWGTGDSVVSKGQIVGIDWNRIARLHSHVLAHMNSLTASRCHINASHMNWGGHRGLLETEKPLKKSLKPAKPQEISSKTENRIKLLTHKALVVFRTSLSVLNFNTYKLILISEVLSGYFLVSTYTEHILA